VALLGGYIFMISGVWPPMVAIESGSMEPNMEVNDLVFVMDTDRFQPDAAHEQTGVVTATDGARTGYEQFGQSGDVIVFQPEGNEEMTPIIHRVMFWVETDENWYDQADGKYSRNAESCDELAGCPAPHAGFITKGDNNPTYDQAGGGRLDPVKPEWVIGTAEYRIPGVGWLRLQF
jgi:signal peptidase